MDNVPLVNYTQVNIFTIPYQWYKKLNKNFTNALLERNRCYLLQKRNEAIGKQLSLFADHKNTMSHVIKATTK